MTISNIHDLNKFNEVLLWCTDINSFIDRILILGKEHPNFLKILAASGKEKIDEHIRNNFTERNIQYHQLSGLSRLFGRIADESNYAMPQLAHLWNFLAAKYAFMYVGKDQLDREMYIVVQLLKHVSDIGPDTFLAQDIDDAETPAKYLVMARDMKTISHRMTGVLTGIDEEHASPLTMRRPAEDLPWKKSRLSYAVYEGQRS